MIIGVSCRFSLKHIGINQPMRPMRWVTKGIDHWRPGHLSPSPEDIAGWSWMRRKAWESPGGSRARHMIILHLSIYLSISLPIYLFICLSIHLIYMCAQQICSIHYIYTYIHIYIYTYIYIHIYIYIYIYTYIYIVCVYVAPWFPISHGNKLGQRGRYEWPEC